MGRDALTRARHPPAQARNAKPPNMKRRADTTAVGLNLTACESDELLPFDEPSTLLEADWVIPVAF